MKKETTRCKPYGELLIIGLGGKNKQSAKKLGGRTQKKGIVTGEKDPIAPR